jgi:hypothetical protein
MTIECSALVRYVDECNDVFADGASSSGPTSSIVSSFPLGRHHPPATTMPAPKACASQDFSVDVR